MPQISLDDSSNYGLYELVRSQQRTSARKKAAGAGLMEIRPYLGIDLAVTTERVVLRLGLLNVALQHPRKPVLLTHCSSLTNLVVGRNSN